MRQVKLVDVNEAVKVVDGKLFFGKHEVKYCDFIKEDSVAALYTVRVFEGGYWRLATTLDLVGRLLWLAGGRMKAWRNGEQFYVPTGFYDNIEAVEYVLNTLLEDTAGKEWAFFEEEDFESNQAQLPPLFEGEDSAEEPAN